jgi:glucose-1-phosphatase
MIRTLIFDLGKVLVPFDFDRGYEGMRPYCPHPPAEMRARLASTDLVLRFESGMVEPRDFVEEMSRILEMRVDYARFCDIWSSIFLPETLIPEAWVERLHGKYRLLLLSNTNAIHFPMVRANYSILNHFDAFVLSHEVKAMKPSPRIYEAALAKAGCAAGECFYTDDIAEYVEGARRLGIDAVQFVSAAALRGELAARNIDWD